VRSAALDTLDDNGAVARHFRTPDPTDKAPRGLSPASHLA